MIYKNRSLTESILLGLYWGTYNAVARRDGVYTSPTVGPVDFNQEVCQSIYRLLLDNSRICLLYILLLLTAAL
jgi:hypothetical protein